MSQNRAALQKGVTLIAASAPTFFIEDTPTAVLVRQVLRAVAQFEKASTVAKLAAAIEHGAIHTGGRQLLGVASGMKSPMWPGGAQQSRILVYGLR